LLVLISASVDDRDPLFSRLRRSRKVVFAEPVLVNELARDGERPAAHGSLMHRMGQTSPVALRRPRDGADPNVARGRTRPSRIRSDLRIHTERATGIEPAFSAWERPEGIARLTRN